MRMVDVYEENGKLTLRVLNQKSGISELLIYNNEAKIYLERLSSYNIKKIREQTIGKDERVLLDFENNINLVLHNSSDLDKQTHLLEPLLNSMKKYEERKNFDNLKSSIKSTPSKVVRENKHANKKFNPNLIAGAILLVGTMVVSMAHNKLSAINSFDMLSTNDVAIEENLDKYEQLKENCGDRIEFLDNDKVMVVDISKEQKEDIVNDDTVKEEMPVIKEEENIIEIEYEDFSNTEKAVKTRQNYGDLITKYSNMYGLDPNLMIAIATQEKGFHSSVMDDGGATGLMQIQNSVWLGKQISAYNYEKGQYDTFTIDNNKIEQLETNIQIGCMYFQNCLKFMDYNIPAAIQTYNYGTGNMGNVLKVYAGITGKTKQEVLGDQYDVGWLEYRNVVNRGDSNYLNNVLSWMGNNNNISVMKPDNSKIDISISNQSNIVKSY